MNYPETIYADTDLVCGEEPKESHEKYIRADLVLALISIVESGQRWSANGERLRLKDTPEWCKLYTAAK